jgi:hypothetical protein
LSTRDSKPRQPALRNPPSAGTLRAASKTRAIVVLFVQRSTIELFGAYGVAVAPEDAPAESTLHPPPSHVLGVVGLSVRSRRGRMAVSMSDATLARTNPDAPDPSARLDWLRELTNQLAGRISNRFARYGIPMTVGLPTTFGSTKSVDHDEKTESGVSLTFRALRDTVHVTLTSCFEDDDLSSQPNVLAVSDEGDIILF